MPPMPASRVGDMHVCPMVTGIVPHVGGPVLPPGGITVLIGGMPAARIGDMCVCVGPPDVIVTGAFTVIVCGMPQARIMDMTAHGGMLILGYPTVIVGDGAGGGGGGGSAGGGAGTASSSAGGAGTGAPAPGASPATGASAAAGAAGAAAAVASTAPANAWPVPDQAVADKLAPAFPKLGNDFEVLGPPTGDYNCIAHTLGVNDEWVNPVTGPKGDELKGMDDMYAKQGYKRLPDKDYSYEPGKEKVVVYATANPDGSIKEVTHGAIQDSSGAWTSKLGASELIRHKTPDALDGSVYGKPVAVYEK